MHEKEKLYEDCLEKWGKELQLIKLIEECSELTQIISKILIGYQLQDNLAEEIADVEIMLEQIKNIYNNHELVVIFKNEKLLRLRKRVNSDLNE